MVAGDPETLYRRVRSLSILMDAAFRMPGTRFRFGLNSLIGLTPGAGDAVLAVVSIWLVWQASKMGLPKTKLVRMIGNIVVETILGSIPFLGDFLDVIWKANMRNLKIIDDHLADRADMIRENNRPIKY